MYEENTCAEAEFLKKHFSAYYTKNVIDSVPALAQREFGYGIYKRKIANRNLAFANVTEMNRFLREQKPLFFSYSNAYYQFPDRKPMSAKEIMKADLIYEFDADEFGEGAQVVNGVQWFSASSLAGAKKQVYRLIDVLGSDFGLSTDGIAINFSGKAGFHVHVRSQEIQHLKRAARIELVDYLTGNGIFYEKVGFDFHTNKIVGSYGRWNKQLVAGIKTFVEKDAKEIARITAFPPRKVKNLLAAKEELIRGLDKGFLIPIEGKKNADFWKLVLAHIVNEVKIPIDRQTSVDMHKIIRVPQTLHGDTGLLAQIIPLDKLTEFDPFTDAVVFGSDEVKVRIEQAPKFTIGGNTYGPYNAEEVSVPLHAAIYLLGKGAKLV